MFPFAHSFILSFPSFFYSKQGSLGFARSLATALLSSHLLTPGAHICSRRKFYFGIIIERDRPQVDRIPVSIQLPSHCQSSPAVKTRRYQQRLCTSRCRPLVTRREEESKKEKTSEKREELVLLQGLCSHKFLRTPVVATYYLYFLDFVVLITANTAEMSDDLHAC